MCARAAGAGTLAKANSLKGPTNNRSPVHPRTPQIFVFHATDSSRFTTITAAAAGIFLDARAPVAHRYIRRRESGRGYYRIEADDY